LRHPPPQDDEPQRSQSSSSADSGTRRLQAVGIVKPRLPIKPNVNLAGLAGVFVYLYTISRTIGLRPDHAFLSLIVLGLLVYGRKWGKLFLIDWSPFILFWVAYDMMRGVADSIRGQINIEGPFRLEQSLFGWLTPADVPPFYFQQFQIAYEGTLIRLLFDLASALMYALHFIAPLILGWFFWQTLNERRTFYLYVVTFTVLNVMALVTFMVYPVAPPWYVYKHGFDQPPGHMLDSAGALVNFDKIVGRRFFVSLYNTFNSNLFAAIPSLHSGYPTTIALCLWLRLRGRTWLFVGYPLLAWFAAVYLNHHYVIDLVIGSLYAVVAWGFARIVLIPLVFDRLVDYEITSSQLLKSSFGANTPPGGQAT
jgi:inositol phosphorylceramide synthase catalytic subunit